MQKLCLSKITKDAENEPSCTKRYLLEQIKHKNRKKQVVASMYTHVYGCTRACVANKE
jgi:hypothetical protein